MQIKRIIAVVLSAATVLSFAACGKQSDNTDTAESTAVYTVEEETASAVGRVETTVPDGAVSEGDTTPGATGAAGETAVTQTDEITKADIVAMYKAAAEKSHAGAKTYRAISLVDFSINNGQYEKAINLVMPIISKLLSNNSTEVAGITGGFRNLTEADVKSAKVYKVGDKTAIELVLHEQTGGARDNAYTGSVGHAITTVGDIGVVTDQITDLGIPLVISDENTVIKYTAPTVKVLVGSDGRIINGTWRYTVAINLNQYKVGNKTVESTKIVMNNVLTVAGGFKK